MLSVAYSEVKPQHSADNSQGCCWSAPVLPNISFFGNYYLVYDVCSSNDFLFIYLDEELVWQRAMEPYNLFNVDHQCLASSARSASSHLLFLPKKTWLVLLSVSMIDLSLLEESVFVNSFFFSASGNNQKDAACMNIKRLSTLLG